MDRKKRVTITLSRANLKQMDEITDNRSEFIDTILTDHFKNIDEVYERKLREEIDSKQKELKDLLLERKRKEAEAIALRKDAEKRLREAIVEFDAQDHMDWSAESVFKFAGELEKKHNLLGEQVKKLNEHIGRVHYGMKAEDMNLEGKM